jgi:hypothetical protein
MNTMTITCDCKVCNGLSAKVRADSRNDYTSKTIVHNTVRIAHSPLARAASVVANGPWKV